MLPQQVSLWNDTGRDYPLDRPITLFLEEQAKKTPDRTAVRFENTEITYAELNRRTNKVARYLGSQGVTTDSLVGVYMERSIEMVVALVAIVKAGGAYVPFDPEYPADRLAFMFEDSAVSLVLTQHRFDDQDIPATIQRIHLDEAVWSQTSPADNENLPLLSHRTSACYMIYTSGSTGKPKGVINVHQGLVNRILWMQDEYQLTPEDRVLQKTPYSFDVSVWEFFWPLITGACIVMAKPGGHRDNAYLVDAIIENKITTMHFVPSMLNLFTGSDGLNRITTLRQVMSSGEALPLALTKRFFEKLPQTRLHNLYGPTEAAIDVTYWECKADSDKNVVPIGHPIANIQMYILDEQMNAVPVGEEGELHIGGIGLARGYWNRPQLNDERFVKNPFGPEGSRLYKTGDLARYLPDGAIEYLGRLDFQVKLRGFRIELGEIEAVLLKHPDIAEAVIVASEDALEEKQLVAYLVTKTAQKPSLSSLRQFLLTDLPDYMVPARFLFLPEMPLLPNGKVNRKALPKDTNEVQDRPELSEMFVAAQSPVEKTLAKLWASLLNLKEVGVRDNFFDLGGNSLMAIRMSAELRKELGRDVPVVKVFQYPTVEKLAVHLSDDGTESQKLLDSVFERATRIRIGRFSGDETDGVAVIGLVGRFPGATSIDQLWDNLVNKVESIERFTPEELAEVDEETRNDPHYVPTRGIVTDADKFDAPFFGIGPLEAKVMDPQQRIFLELAWAALENAGYDPAQFPGMIGVFAGVGDNHYYTNHVLGHPDIVKTVGKMIVGYGNEKDYVATRASYCLNLTGPSVSANTGCSTSLLSVDHAFKSLIDFESDMALAGGVDLFFPQKSGQIFEEGGTFTEDGHCRPFDEKATGTMFCDGAGIVVLRRLEDAIAAGDTIYAVVRGVAKNNDGANKVSFLAPSVEGQAQVIALAQAQANTPADTISYIEAHGTGTPLGDPIEVEALTKAFRATTDKTQFCHIGSIKGNIGHPTIASGVAGFMKATLALHHEVIPATLHFNKPNPKIDFANSPFHVVKDTTPWPRGPQPRRAGVSSFGFGGTNVHAVLEEAPLPRTPGPSRPQQVLLLSAKTEAALGRLRRSYADFLKAKPETNLADMAYTLVVGRRSHAFREFVTAGSAAEAVAQLIKNDERKTPAPKLAHLNPEVVFLFPGQGSQYVNMGLSLYAQEPVFRQWVNTCCDILKPHLDRDLRELLFPEAGDEKTAAESLKDTYYTQPALFTIEYSLARFWMSLGLVPSALVGHSVGEFVAAAISGIVTLEEILPMVALRGRLIRGLPRGSMLSVRTSAAEVVKRLPADIQLAASNSPTLCVVAGPTDSIAAFAKVLDAEGLMARELHTSHAFHSAMMDPVVGEYVAAMSKVTFSKGQIPILSTCTAEWLTDEVASSPEYWGRHLRMPVLFSNAVSQLLKEPGKVYLEVGPRDVLTTLARQHVGADQRDKMVATLAATADDGAEWTAFLSAVGQLWALGVALDWNAYFGREQRGRIPLPTYPFERTSHWLPPVNRWVSAPVPAAPAAAPSPVEASAPTLSPTPQPGDPILAGLSAILQETLGVPLDARDEETPFLALGADSLLLMQLGRVVQSRYGLSVTFRQLVEEYATPRQLADAIRDVTGGTPAVTAPAPSAVPVRPVAGGRQTLPATASQRAMWVTTQRENLGFEAGCADIESFTLRLRGAVNDNALAEGLQTLAVFHEALRGHFADGGAAFVIEPAVTVPVDHHDLSAVPGARRAETLAQILAADARTPYDLDQGPLFRAAVVRLAADERVVLLSAHRAACDGWSLDVVLEDFSKIYSALSAGRPLPPAPRHGVSDYSALHERSQAKRAADRDLWRTRLQAAPEPLHLAGSPLRPDQLTYGAVDARQVLAPETLAAARSFSRAQGLSLFSVLLSAFSAVLHQKSGAADFVVGVPMAGHPDAGMEDAVGSLARVVPLRVQARGSFLEFCRESQKTILDAREHAVDFHELDGTEVSVAFSHMHKYSADKLVFEGCASDYTLNSRAFETYELSLNVIEAAEQVELVAHGNAALFKAGWMADLLTDTEAVLRQGCGAPGTGLSLLKATTPGQRQARDPRGPARVLIEAPIIVTLQKGKPNRTPLLCLLGIQLYFDLAQAIQDGTPVVGIHLPMLHVPGVTQKPSLAEVAAHYLQVVRKVQPRGPYQLAGLCLGGMVAYEVGRQLQAQGEAVTLVVTFDAVLPNGRHTDLVRKYVERAAHPVKALGRFWNRLSRRPAAQSAARGELIDLPYGTPGAVADIERLVRPQPILEGQLLAFQALRADLAPWDIIHQDMGWNGTARSVDYRAVDADHLGIVRKPNAQSVAAAIQEKLLKE